MQIQNYLRMKIYILFGAPGAGKGTQAAMLAQKYKLLHWSTGDMLRAEVKSGSPLGKEIDSLISVGKLVNDQLISQMVIQKIIEHKAVEGIILDGFPRTLAQAQILHQALEKEHLKIEKVINLEVNHEEVIQRILLRGSTSNRADDQDESTIRQRLQVYETQTKPLIDYYQHQKTLINIEGMGSIEDIFNRITPHF